MSEHNVRGGGGPGADRCTTCGEQWPCRTTVHTIVVLEVPVPENLVKAHERIAFLEKMLLSMQADNNRLADEIHWQRLKYKDIYERWIAVMARTR